MTISRIRTEPKRMSGPSPQRPQARRAPGPACAMRAQRSTIRPASHRASSAQRVGQIPDASEEAAQVARRVVGGQHARQRYRLVFIFYNLPYLFLELIILYIYFWKKDNKNFY